MTLATSILNSATFPNHCAADSRSPHKSSIHLVKWPSNIHSGAALAIYITHWKVFYSSLKLVSTHKLENTSLATEWPLSIFTVTKIQSLYLGTKCHLQDQQGNSDRSNRVVNYHLNNAALAI